MPSDIQMEVNMEDFGKTMQTLAGAARRDIRDVLRQQCKLLVVDLIKSTPPTGNRPLTESWNFQKRKGEMTVDRDIDRLFQPLTSIRAVMEPTLRGKPSRRDELKHMAEHGEWNELSEALFDMHVTDDRVPITGTITLEEYRSVWKLFATRGNVSKKRARAHLIWDSSALALVRREVKERVGWAKGGWNPAARALGVTRLPRWIADKDSPGGIIDETQGDEPSVTLINSVAYIAYLNVGNRLLARAMRNRERAMEISLEHAVEHFVEEFNGG